MGTRESRSFGVHHDPTIKPGLGSARCLSLLNPTKEHSEWKITPVQHDASTVAGSGLGGMRIAVHGFNTGMPYVQKCLKGEKWLRFVLGVPPLLMFSASSAAFGGYALPEFTQLTVTSYYSASSATHYGISLLNTL